MEDAMGKKILEGKCLCVNSVFLSLLTFLYSLYKFSTISTYYFYNLKKINKYKNKQGLFVF